MTSTPTGTEVPDEVRPVVRQRVARRRRRSRRVTAAQGLFTLVALVVLVALVWVGWRSAMRITGGRNEMVTDPAAPGYVAEARPTGTTLVAVTGEDEELVSMLVVVSDPTSGRLTAAPMSPGLTLWDFEGAPPQSAADVFAEGGIDALRQRLGADLAFGMTDAVVVPGSGLALMASDSGPVTLQLADYVLEGSPEITPDEATVRYPSGELQLEPDDIDDFLAFNGYREPESNRALRSGALWTELIGAQTGAPDPAAFGGGADAETFSELVGEMVESEMSVELVPTLALPLDVEPPVSIYRIDPFVISDWVASNVPFPIAAYPGQFATVAIVDGTGTDGAIRTVAPRVVGAGAEIVLVGNADSFDVATTRVEYARAEARPAAERIADALGVEPSPVVDERADVDVTVVVGKDLVP